MNALRKIRLAAAIALVCAIVLPMSECSRRADKTAIAPRHTIPQWLFPQDNDDFQYSYVIGVVRPSTWQAGIFALIALLWPLTACLADRKIVRKRFGWLIYILELGLCYGTIYWLVLFTALGRRLYGVQVVFCSVLVFAAATLVLLCIDIRNFLRQRRGLKMSNSSV